MKKLFIALSLFLIILIRPVAAQIETQLRADLSQFGSVNAIYPFGDDKVLFALSVGPEFEFSYRPWIYDVNTQQAYPLSELELTGNYFRQNSTRYTYSMWKEQNLFNVVKDKVYFWVRNGVSNDYSLMQSDGTVSNTKVIYTTGYNPDIQFFVSHENAYILDYAKNPDQTVEIYKVTSDTLQFISSIDYSNNLYSGIYKRQRVWVKASFENKLFFSVAEKLYFLDESTFELKVISPEADHSTGDIYFISEDFELIGDDLYFTYNECGYYTELGFEYVPIVVVKNSVYRYSFSKDSLYLVNLNKEEVYDFYGKGAFSYNNEYYYIESNILENDTSGEYYFDSKIYKCLNDSLYVIKDLGESITLSQFQLNHAFRYSIIPRYFKVKFLEHNGKAYLGLYKYSIEYNNIIFQMWSTDGTFDGTQLVAEPFVFSKYGYIEDTLNPDVFTYNISQFGSRLIQYKSTSFNDSRGGFYDNTASLNFYNFIENSYDDTLKLGDINISYFLPGDQLLFGNTVGNNYFFAATLNDTTTTLGLWSLQYVPNTSLFELQVTDTTVCEGSAALLKLENGDPFLDVQIKDGETVLETLPSYPNRNKALELNLPADVYNINYTLVANNQDLENRNFELTILPTPEVQVIDELRATDSTYTYTVSNESGLAYYWSVEGGDILFGLGTSQIEVKWSEASSSKVSLLISNEECSTDTILFERTTGINNKTFNCTLFPNPSNSSIQIRLPEEWSANQTLLRIFSMDGRLVMQKTSNERIVPVDIRSLQEGSYYVQLNAEDKTATASFVKLR